jgi:AraC family transcriptional regulator
MIVLEKANYLGQVHCLQEAGGLIASITAYQRITYAENLHSHETLHLSLVLQGGNLEKRKHGAIERLPGTVTYYDAGEPHQSTRILPGSRHVNLEITGEFLSKYELTSDAASLEKCHHAGGQFFMLKLYKELLINDPDSWLSIESALLQAMRFASRSHQRAGTPAWVVKIREMLHDRWNERLTLDELALIANLHPANLSGYFPVYFGCTLGEYRRKIKVSKAMDLFRHSHLSLTAIAIYCGFADQSHLIRACKALTGWTPKKLKML